MADGTKIEWAHAGLGRGASWNPIRARNLATGAIGHYCEHASPGCVNCYSEAWNRDRLGTRLPFKPGHRKDVEIFLDEKALLQPLHWRAPRGIFVCSMTDAFGAFVSDDMLDRIFAVAALCPQHRLLILTKRSARMRAYFTDGKPGTALRYWQTRVYDRIADIETDAARRFAAQAVMAIGPLPNVWLGVSAEDQTRADERIPDLLATPAAVRWVSAEPLLGPIQFERTSEDQRRRHNWLTGEVGVMYQDGPDFDQGPSLDWIVVGGESGPNARPMHPQWARDIRDQCAAAGAPFFFKQHGEWIGVPDLRNLPDGRGPGFGAYDHCKHDIDAECVRVGKKAAGRLLDGREHNAMPKVPA